MFYPDAIVYMKKNHLFHPFVIIKSIIYNEPSVAVTISQL